MTGLCGRSASRHGRLTWWLTVVLLATSASHALQAQGDPSRWAVTVGPEWYGATRLGEVNATETGNGTPPVTVFQTSTRLDGGIGVSAGIGVRVTSSLWAETAVRSRSTRLLTDVTGDIEGATPTTASESVQHLQIEAGAQWVIRQWQRGRFTPYLSGGAGYVRQLHGDATLVTSGASGYGGGGVLLELPARAGGTFQSLALRFDARAEWLGSGVTFDDAAHVAPALGAAIVFRW